MFIPDNTDPIVAVDEPIIAVGEPVESIDISDNMDPIVAVYEPVKSIDVSDNMDPIVAVDEPVKSIDISDNMDPIVAVDEPVKSIDISDNMDPIVAVDEPVKSIDVSDNMDPIVAVDEPVKSIDISDNMDPIVAVDEPVNSIDISDNMDPIVAVDEPVKSIDISDNMDPIVAVDEPVKSIDVSDNMDPIVAVDEPVKSIDISDNMDPIVAVDEPVNSIDISDNMDPIGPRPDNFQICNVLSDHTYNCSVMNDDGQTDYPTVSNDIPDKTDCNVSNDLNDCSLLNVSFTSIELDDDLSSLLLDGNIVDGDELEEFDIIDINVKKGDFKKLAGLPDDLSLIHCEALHCVDEVFSACCNCSIYMCYDHFMRADDCSTHFAIVEEHCEDESLDGSIYHPIEDEMSSGTEVYECCPSPTNQRLKVKIRRLYGKAYVSKYKDKLHKIHSVERDNKVLKNRCKHGSKEKKQERSFRCSEVSDDHRMSIFKYFWDLREWSARKCVIKSMTDTRGAVRRRNAAARSSKKHQKNEMHDCFLTTADGRKVRVCKQMFLSTYGIGVDQFRRWTSREVQKKRKPRPTQYDESRKKDVEDWLATLPKVPSHYCRSSTSYTYVENTFLSKSNMHKEYCRFLISQDESKKPVSRPVFVKILKKLKIAIHKPRKDQCDVCYGFKNGNISQDEFDEHWLRKNESSAAKKQAKAEASDETVVVHMDLQSVLLSPRLRASAAYYKLKLQIHNFTVYRINDSNVQLFVWHEGEGGVSSNEFVSCIVSYISSLPATVTKIIIISDGCCYQNRNKSLSSSLSDIAMQRNITIEQIILEKGHTMNAADSVHSTLEQVLTRCCILQFTKYTATLF